MSRWRIVAAFALLTRFLWSPHDAPSLRKSLAEAERTLGALPFEPDHPSVIERLIDTPPSPRALSLRYDFSSCIDCLQGAIRGWGSPAP